MRPTTPRASRGFTLVELAIVIVIAGILAAVAIPIYQGIIEKSKWTEGKTNASQVNAALKVAAAEHSRTVPVGAGAMNYTVGAADAIDWVYLDMVPAEYDSDTFLNADYTCSTPAAGTWQITVTPGAAPSTPTGGPYIVDEGGTVIQDAP